MSGSSFRRNTAGGSGGALFLQSRLVPPDGSPANTLRLMPATAASSSPSPALALAPQSPADGTNAFMNTTGSSSSNSFSTILRENSAASDGGAIYADVPPGGRLLLYGTDMTSNSATNGGAMCAAMGAGSRLEASGARMRANAARGSGGAVQVTAGGGGGSVVISDSVLRENSALGRGGALSVLLLSNGSSTASSSSSSSAVPLVATLTAVVLDSNSAGQGGGGADLGPGVAADLANCTLVNNAALGGAGGGIYATGCPWLSLTGGTALKLNSAMQGSGGGLCAGGCARVLLDSAIVYDNYALVAGGGLHLVAGDVDASGVELDDADDALASPNSAVGNSSGSSGVRRMALGGATDGSWRRLVLIHNSSFDGNRAARRPGSTGTVSGGADAAAGLAFTTSSGNATTTTTTVWGMGGALFMTDGVVAAVSSSTFGVWNSAPFGWAISTQGDCSSSADGSGIGGRPAPPPVLSVPQEAGGAAVALQGPVAGWTEVWGSLGAAAAQGCSMLALVGGTRLAPGPEDTEAAAQLAAKVSLTAQCVQRPLGHSARSLGQETGHRKSGCQSGTHLTAVGVGRFV